MKFKISTQIQEAIYRAEVSKIFLEHGWMVYTPEADVGGVDFLVMNLETEEVRKIQLKGRWTVDKKYHGKNIWMCFSLKDKWYVCEHDKMVEIGLQCGLLLWEQKNGDARNAYSVEPMSKKMTQMMSAYQFPKVFEEFSKPSNYEYIDNTKIKSTKDKSSKKVGIGEFIKTQIYDGKDNKSILEMVYKKFPNAKTKSHNISWYRSDISKKKERK